MVLCELELNVVLAKLDEAGKDIEPTEAVEATLEVLVEIGVVGRALDDGKLLCDEAGFGRELEDSMDIPRMVPKVVLRCTGTTVEFRRAAMNRLAPY